jgi:hypothetical protein
MKGENANFSGYRNSVRHKAGRNFFRKRKGEYLKNKIIELIAGS